MSDQIERRDFLKSSAASAALTTAGIVLSPEQALAQTAKAGANDRIVVALIGPGRQGRGLLSNFVKQPDVDVAAVCDV